MPFIISGLAAIPKIMPIVMSNEIIPSIIGSMIPMLSRKRIKDLFQFTMAAAG
jgi:hypothetical protein